MTKRELPSPDLLRQLLRYEPEIGKFYWRERRPEHLDGLFADRSRDLVWRVNSWNRRYAGKEALKQVDYKGYRVGKLLEFTMAAHRVAWAIYHGEWPRDQVDHIDGDRSNNRIANLRLVDNSENLRNAKLPVTNTSGHIGIGFHKRMGRWQAYIARGGRQVFLGYFTDIADAVKARETAEVEAGYHPNHGRRQSI
ncbi:HNH endonuclease signature motif containing protein [Sphingobium yanoikuyae]|jgi:HNH endonuclease|uniref:HNH endonuclease signature motif containing protein n=1 Tax=Sphingobium yanoikuyae TaxID=13690 RepID=UPI0009BCE8D4|nr:HNH endonuclease signature motif containing protein [Sphingobium yanoikuyae]